MSIVDNEGGELGADDGLGVGRSVGDTEGEKLVVYEGSVDGTSVDRADEGT